MPGRLSPDAVPARLSALLALLLVGALLGAGCNSALVHGLATAGEHASATPWSYAPRAEEPQAEEGARLLARFAPVFVVEEGAAPSNRIGTPCLARQAGIERARVDVAQPTLYGEARAERVGACELWQLVYRVHFDQYALSASTFASLHRNAGLLVLVSVERASGRPLLVTTVHTCGCWCAFQPTAALARAALPDGWPAGPFEFHGESLAAELPVPAEGERFVVRLRTRTHRVSAVEVAAPPADARALPLVPYDALHALPIAGAPGRTGSFFYEAGSLRGYVKGSWPPLEGLTLGLLTLDPRLGMDRDFGDPAVTGARFATAIAPWKREDSRLDRFEHLLGERGFHTAAFGAAP